MKNRENRPEKKGKAVAFWGCLALAAVISGGNVKGTVYAAEAAVVEAIYDADETGEYGGLFYGDGESVPGSEGQNDGEGKGNSSAGVNSGNGEGYDILVCEEFSCLEFHTDRDTINWILKTEYRRSLHGKTTQKNHRERHRLCSRW